MFVLVHSLMFEYPRALSLRYLALIETCAGHKNVCASNGSYTQSIRQMGMCFRPSMTRLQGINKRKLSLYCHILSPAYILATVPVYDPTELSRANRVATVQRSLRRLNHDPIQT